MCFLCYLSSSATPTGLFQSKSQISYYFWMVHYKLKICEKLRTHFYRAIDYDLAQCVRVEPCF